MEIKETKKGSVSVVEVCWKLDVGTSPILEKKILSMYEKGDKFIILDFGQVNYVSSSGLRVILLTEKKAKETGGKVVLAAVADHIKNVFDIAGFTPMFIICDSVDEALKQF